MSLDYEQRIIHLQRRFSKMNMVGGPGVDIAGSLATGYAINVKLTEAATTTSPTPAECPETLSVAFSGMTWCAGGSVGDLAFSDIPRVADHVSADGFTVCAWLQVTMTTQVFVGFIVESGVWEVNFYGLSGHDPDPCDPYVGLGTLIAFNGRGTSMSAINNALTSCCPNFVFSIRNDNSPDLALWGFNGNPTTDDFDHNTWQAMATGGTATISTP